MIGRQAGQARRVNFRVLFPIRANLSDTHSPVKHKKKEGPYRDDSIPAIFPWMPPNPPLDMMRIKSPARTVFDR